jgi:hypothetical protein
MDAQQVNQTFDLVTYAGNLVSLKPAKNYQIGPCPMCGGRDRFQIKRTQTGDVWLCRKCSPGKYKSAIDFLMTFHNEKFIDALQRAGGDITAPAPRQGKPVQAPAPVQVLPPEEWQRDAWEFVTAAAERLTDTAEGEQGRRYLLARGISPAMMDSALLGFAEAYGRPAIVIPWTDTGNVITAVKYRFIDPLASQDKGRRFSMMAGSMPYLYGCDIIRDSDKTLLFVEGELNAVSIMQTRPEGVSVISGGSEGNGNAALLRALARHYDRVVIWTDDPEKGRGIRERMNRPEARLLKSPVLDSVKYDANQMLRAGLLADFISAELATVCNGRGLQPQVIEYMGASVAQEVSAAGRG